MDLEQATDELYAAPPEAFVGERSRLVKELKAAGRGEDAQQLAKARKPSLAAWALNQLARRNRREVDLLLDAGHRLREAQAGLLGGADKEAFEQAVAAEREAVARLTREAAKLLDERGSGSAAMRNQVEESLRAAAVSAHGRELLARGRFAEPIRSEGFELVDELAASLPLQTDRPRAPTASDEERRQAAQALREAKARLRSLERDARDARREAERLRARAHEAERKAERADAEVEAAASAVAEAQARLRRDRT